MELQRASLRNLLASWSRRQLADKLAIKDGEK
jgi:hypothetical protein